MKAAFVLLPFLICGIAVAQTEETSVVPVVTSVNIEPGTVTLLHLRPGYATSVRLSEDVRSIVLGDPANFKAEHSESEPRLVFLKPISKQPGQTNALITTKSGQQISLHLVSDRKSAQPRVDFCVEYQPQPGFIVSADRSSFLIADSEPLSVSASIPLPPEKTDRLADELEKQKHISSPKWAGRGLLASVGESVRNSQQTIVGFSVLNDSKSPIDLVTPQIELRGASASRKAKSIKAEPIGIAEYRLTARHLEPGQRADGVVVYERPSFKESSERLELRIAEASQVDRPIFLPLPFAAIEEGHDVR